ncbi:MAG: sel1 repeat family protein [Campylobacteraceae bacterium]|nr:sel1 repeat family protein [Campylobacteraceae bacterium]
MNKTLLSLVLVAFTLNASERDFFGTNAGESAPQTQVNGNSDDTKRDYFNEGHKAFEDQKYEKSKEIWTKLCEEENDGRSCTNLAWLYDQGLGIPVDKELARKYYEKGCELGNGLGCLNLADTYFRADSVDKNFNVAFKYYVKACELDEPRACAQVGYMYEFGDGTERSYEKAYEFYEKSCEMGYGEGCTNLGTLYVNGHGIEAPNTQKAEEYFIKGCDLGHEQGCKFETALKEMRLKGEI